MLVSTHVGSEAALELLGISRAEYGHGRIDVAVGRVVGRSVVPGSLGHRTQGDVGLGGVEVGGPKRLLDQLQASLAQVPRLLVVAIGELERTEVDEYVEEVRVIGRETALADRLSPRVVVPRQVTLILLRSDDPEVRQAQREVGVVRGQVRLTDRLRALALGPRLIEVAEVEVRDVEIGERTREIGMHGAEGMLEHRYRAPEGPARSLEIAELELEHAEVVEHEAHVRVIRADPRSPDLVGAGVGGSGLVIATQKLSRLSAVEWRDVHAPRDPASDVLSALQNAAARARIFARESDSLFAYTDL